MPDGSSTARPRGSLFHEATTIAWTRDPLDRLLVAHARLRAWRLATADTQLLEDLSAAEMLDSDGWCMVRHRGVSGGIGLSATTPVATPPISE